MNLPPRTRRASVSTRLAVALIVVATLAGCAGRRGIAAATPASAPASAASVAPSCPPGIPTGDDLAALANADDPTTRAWVAAENACARRHLDAMPARVALRQRLQSLMESAANDYTQLVERGGLVFALKAASPAQRPVLVALKSIDDVGGERVLFSPVAATKGESLAIDFFRPSPDGRRVLLSLSTGERTMLRVLDVATGQSLPDEAVPADAAADGGDATWGIGDVGYFHTRVSGSGAAQLVFHALGAGASQERVELDGLPAHARIRLRAARDGRHLLALVDEPGGAASLYLGSVDAKGGSGWRRLSAGGDGVRDAQFGDDDAIWIHAVANAPRGKLLRLSLAASRAIAWDRLAPVALPQEGSVQRFAVVGGTLFLAEGDGAASRLRVIDLRTKRSSVLALPSASRVAALERVGRGEMLVELASPLEPPRWMRVSGGHAKRTPLAATSDASFNDSEVVREPASARDGTPVPLDVLRRKGTRLDGRNPVLLEIAGATPTFDAARRAWLDRGGVVALLTPRARPEDGVDDVEAAASRLVERGYTQPALLAVRGSGDGARVAAMALISLPEAFRAMVAVDGHFDLPLTVRDGVDYPAMLLRASADQAAPSRRLAARLQQADPHGRAILLLTETLSGRSTEAGLAQAVDATTDELGFLLDEVVAAQ